MGIAYKNRTCVTRKAAAPARAHPRLTLLLFCSLPLLLTLFAAYCLRPASVNAQTELGSEDDLTVLGVNGTALDPDTEIKGFTVFGSTQAAYPGVSAGPGNVVVNGALAVSSGAYFADSSTFTAAAKIFIGDGSAGQILSKRADGALQWASAGAMGDDLGSHIATTTLQMGAYGINTSSSITAARYQISGSTVLAILPGFSSLGVGKYAGNSNTSGDYCTFVGNDAGSFNTSGDNNTFVGNAAGYANTTGRWNSYFGQNAGRSGTTGEFNSVFGNNAGTNNRTGSANALFGAMAGEGYTAESFSSTTVMGYQAGDSLRNGSADNIFIGFKAGYSVTTGTGNIVIGYDEDTSAIAAKNELNIGGVLYGNLSARTIGISTRIPQAALDVVSTGTAANQMAQIWRNTGAGIVSSMSATGVMMAAKFIGDGSGLTGVGGQAEIFVSTINAAAATPYGGVNITTNTFVSGNVGIGTKNPASPLTIYSNSNTASDTVSIYNPNAGSLAVAAYDLHNNEGTGYLWVGSSNYTGDVIGQNQLLVDSAFKNGLGLAANNGGGIKFYTTGYSQRMTLTDNGTVGISTGNPQAALDVVSTGTAANIYAQIWRDSTGTIVSSMTATGKLTAASVQVVSSVTGSYTAYISTSSAAGSYSVAVSSLGITNINNLVIENRVSDPAAPVTGQIWLRTN